jgi:hypothetical protein
MMFDEPYVCMPLTSLFASLYCGTLSFLVAYNHVDMAKYLPLAQMIDKRGRLLGIWTVPLLNPKQFDLVGLGLIVSLAFVACGIAIRVSLAIAILSYFFYFGQIIEAPKVGRKTNLIPQVLLILFIATWSSSHATSEWPLILVKGVVAQLYLSSALTKIRQAGIRWASAHQIRCILLQEYLLYDIPLAARLASHPRLCGFLGTTTLAFELTFWFVLIWPKTAALYAISGVAFHIATRVFLRVDYLTFHSAVYLVFVVGLLL